MIKHFENIILEGMWEGYIESTAKFP